MKTLALIESYQDHLAILVKDIDARSSIEEIVALPRFVLLSYEIRDEGLVLRVRGQRNEGYVDFRARGDDLVNQLIGGFSLRVYAHEYSQDDGYRVVNVQTPTEVTVSNITEGKGEKLGDSDRFVERTITIVRGPPLLSGARASVPPNG